MLDSMDEQLAESFIEHMNAEFESYYLYLSMAGYFEINSWPGFANWMHQQAEEERLHAMKFFDFLSQRGVKPRLLKISEPEDSWDNPLVVFQASFEHEQLISSKIHELTSKSFDAKDYSSQPFLNWFIEEQVEEEATVGGIVDRLKRVHDDPKGMMLLDAELGKRTAENNA